MRESRLGLPIWLVCIGLFVAACNDDVACPGGRTLQMDVCVCPPGSVEMGEECVSFDSGTSPSTGVDANARTDAKVAASGDSGFAWEEDARDSGEAGAARDGGANSDVAPDAYVVDGRVSSAEDSAVGAEDAGPSCVPTAETCNGKDDDCDQQVDEEVSEAPLGTACSNGGQGVCGKMGKQACLNGVVMCNAPPPTPSAEICDGIDNDCNGKVDDGAAFAEKGMTCTTGTGDCEGTGIRECDPADPSKLRCTAVEKPKTCGSSCTPLSTGECTAGAGDCLGTGVFVCDAAMSAPRCTAVAKVKNACGISCGPLPAETCGDGADNDCNGTVDDGCGPAVVNWYPDCDGDGFAKSTAGAVPSATAPAPTAGCLGWTNLKPDEATHTNWDCSDAGGEYAAESALYHPGADFFAASYWGTSWDFNCDGVNTPGPKLANKRPADCSAALIDYYNINGNCDGQTVAQCAAYITTGNKMTAVPPASCPDSPVIVSVATQWDGSSGACTVGAPDPARNRYTCK